MTFFKGATEFSFEELRAIKYNRIRAERETAEIEKENERRRLEYEKEVSLVKNLTNSKQPYQDQI